MSGWVEVAIAGLGLLGSAFAGHKRAAKAAATTAQVLAWAREASYLVCQVARSAGKVDAARAIALWSTEFAELAARAGFDITKAQHELAAAEARTTIGRVAMTMALDDLQREMDRFEPGWARTKVLIDEAKAEQDQAKKRYAERHPEKKS